MRPLQRNNNPGRICLPIVESSVARALRAIEKANPLADLIELRMDYLPDSKLQPLLKAGEKPFIVTYRRQKGRGEDLGEGQKRLDILRQAVDLGAAYVDVELEHKPSFLYELISNHKKTKIILSFHDFKRTPSTQALRGLFMRMLKYGTDVLKIVTMAQTWEDNLKILSLLPYARERKQKIVTFCMGEKGKMSRVFSPLMGAAWTYAALDRKKTSAPGQLTALEMKEIWEKLK